MILRADHVAGGIAIAAALAVLAVSGDLPLGTLAFPGAGMLPKLVCVLMILFGVLLIARAGQSPPFAEISWSDLPHAVRVLGVTAAAVALYTTLGFIITMSLLLFVPLAHAFTFAPGQGWVSFLPQLGWGAFGGWIAVLIYIIVLGTALYLRWRSRAWQAIYL